MKLIETERLILRQWELSDVDDLYEYAKDIHVGPNAGWQPHKTKEESLKIIEHFIYESEVYAIVLKSENKVIGSLGLHTLNCNKTNIHLDKEVGFVLGKKYWGQGYMTEAVNAVIDYCFHHLMLDKLWVRHFETNERSKKLINRLGFHYVSEKEIEVEAFPGRLENTLTYVLNKNEII
jgi:RimJ/RimL family protein N-acetyltransferase